MNPEQFRLRVARIIDESDKKGLWNTEIAKKLGLTVAQVMCWRKRLGMQWQRKSKRLYVKDCICKIINEENAIECLPVEKIHVKLIKTGPRISINVVRALMRELKIPMSRSTRKYSHSRQYIYFTRGRVVWMADGKHKVKKGEGYVGY